MSVESISYDPYVSVYTQGLNVEEITVNLTGVKKQVKIIAVSTKNTTRASGFTLDINGMVYRSVLDYTDSTSDIMHIFNQPITIEDTGLGGSYSLKLTSFVTGDSTLLNIHTMELER
jgi:hypothetical protein